MQGVKTAMQCNSVCGICHTLVQTSHPYPAGLGIVQVTVCATNCASKPCQRLCVQCMRDLFWSVTYNVQGVAALMLCMQTDTIADCSPPAVEQLADGPIQLLA